MDATYSSDDEVSVVYSNDVGNLAYLVLISPACNFLGILDRAKSVGTLNHIVNRMRINSE